MTERDGNRMRTLPQLRKAADAGRYVKCPEMFGWEGYGILPANTVLCFSGRYLERAFRAGMYLAERTAKGRARP